MILVANKEIPVLRFPLRAIVLACLLAFLPTLAMAKSYTIPNPNPVAVVTIPDDWDVTEIAKGVEADSEDEEVYIAIEVTEVRKAEQAVLETIAWLMRRGVEADTSTEKQKPLTINGMEGFEISWSGKDKDGPTQISVTILKINESNGLVLTYWASPEGTKANMDDLVKIISSLKPVR